MITIMKPEEARRRLIFSNNLRYLIHNGPVGAIELAKKIGVSTSTVYGYSRGPAFPTEERIQQIADGLGVTVDDLFDDTYAPWKFGESIE